MKKKGMLEKREGTPSCLKLFDYFVKYFLNQKTDGQGIFHRAIQSQSIARRRGRVSGEGKQEHRSKEGKSIARRKESVSGEEKEANCFYDIP
ncbi:MAG: hypothetical protein D3913_14650 [Candidatus Electrothrix sp. LOE1_4_5]|nr:hypothetical protein [Candidatus Electrothrix sp. AX1]MCI5119150.1 hypothetical protein [Candidatus Electrothrix gigas]